MLIPFLPSTKSAFLCAFALRNPRFRAFRAQNRGFCALFAFGTPIFGHFEHKIGIFVSETAIFPWFWPLPSTKLGFLCAFASKFLPDSAPASNKPHSAEKSTPVWLAIWRTWAGFANSQLLPDAAAFSSIQGPPRSGNSSAQTSASLHPPAALRLRVLPFTRTWSSTVCAEEFPTPLEMSLHGLPLLRYSKSVGPSAPIAYATSVSPPDEAAARQVRRS